MCYHEETIYCNDNLRDSVASSNDILRPSEPLSKEYNIVDGMAAVKPRFSCQRETIATANICMKIVHITFVSVGHKFLPPASNDPLTD